MDGVLLPFWMMGDFLCNDALTRVGDWSLISLITSHLINHSPQSLIIKLLFHIHEIHEKLNNTAGKYSCLLSVMGHISEQKDHVVYMNISNMATHMIEKINWTILISYYNFRHSSFSMKCKVALNSCVIIYNQYT